MTTDLASIMGGLYGDGIIAAKGAFDARWADELWARLALTIHRGTANRSSVARPVLVLGFDAPGAPNAIRHDLQVSRRFYETLPRRLRDHLACRVVEDLEPIHQAHQIEGLLRGMA